MTTASSTSFMSRLWAKSRLESRTSSRSRRRVLSSSMRRTLSTVDADVAGEALGERHLLAAVVARVLRPVVDEHADLALERAHGQDEHALEAHVRGERRQRRRVAAGEVPRDGGVGAQRLRGQRHARRSAAAISRASTPRPKPARPIQSPSSSSSSTPLVASSCSPRRSSAYSSSSSRSSRVPPLPRMSAPASESWARSVGVVADRREPPDEIREHDERGADHRRRTAG